MAINAICGHHNCHLRQSRKARSRHDSDVQIAKRRVDTVYGPRTRLLDNSRFQRVLNSINHRLAPGALLDLRWASGKPLKVRSEMVRDTGSLDCECRQLGGPKPISNPRLAIGGGTKSQDCQGIREQVSEGTGARFYDRKSPTSCFRIAPWGVHYCGGLRRAAFRWGLWWFKA